MAEYYIRPTEPEDADWIEQFTIQHSNAPFVVAHGELYYPHQLHGFVAEAGDECLGLVTYRLDQIECEVITLDSTLENHGVGTALLESVVAEAQAIGCIRLWLITTNDNLRALAFYQKRGFELVEIHRNAVDRSREIKPQIPLVGDSGIPIRDEIELELYLGPEKQPRH
ncbi:MAG: GNAT family N-acetyltransferase [Candidatus Latescibacterota bacterium]|jgi:GNAT superfamily N-acetyltransferase